jgi:peptide/nickel transport system ATP-binding protein
MSLLAVDDLRVYYYSHLGTVKAVDGISFTLSEREFLGLAGESGCGKTTASLALLGLISKPGRIVGGKISVNGQAVETFETVRGKVISMVFQGAMNALNPLFRVDEQIAEPLAVHRKIDFRSARELARNYLELVGIPQDRHSAYPHELSGGMKQRAVIAMALSLEPKIVILDEPTTALDVIVQRKIIDLIKDLRQKLGISFICISHDITVLAEICDRLAVMYAGRIVEQGETERVVDNPLHPYTKALMGSILWVDSESRGRGRVIEGEPPSLMAPPAGCRFHPRCPLYRIGKFEECLVTEPTIREVVSGRFVACHYAEKALE